MLLLAAAEPTGEPALLWRSAARAELSTDAVGPAVGDGILELGTRITFRHPLLRSAIYRSASAEDRRAAHRALAAVTDAELDPDRRAWHLARAALGPDEDVADELERSAGRAQARGRSRRGRCVPQRAAALSVDPRERARRALAAAEAKQLAGSPQEALSLLASGGGGAARRVRPRHAPTAPRADRAGLEASARRRTAPARRSQAPGTARRELMRETYLEALASSKCGRPARQRRAGSGEAARRRTSARPGPPHATDLLLDGLALRFTNGYARQRRRPHSERWQPYRDEGCPGRVTCAGRGSPGESPPTCSTTTPGMCSPPATFRSLGTRGALAVLRWPLNLLALLRCFEGQLAAAGRCSTRPTRSRRQPKRAPMVFGRIAARGMPGDEARGSRVDRGSRGRGRSPRRGRRAHLRRARRVLCSTTASGSTTRRSCPPRAPATATS